MAADTGKYGADTSSSLNHFDDFTVTLPAGPFGDLPIVRFDSQRLWKIPGSEGKGMPESIRGLGCILRKESRRGMAIIADGDLAMTRLDPAVVILRHDVAVCAGGWIFGQVGRALRIDKGISSHAYCQAYGCCQQRSLGRAQHYFFCANDRIWATSC